MSPWSPPPVFAHGQYLSAEAHLNTLARCVEHVFALYLRNQTPFTGYSWRGIHKSLRTMSLPLPDGWRRAWRGAIRHKRTLLRYRIAYSADAVTGLKLRIVADNIHTVVLNVQSGAGEITGTIDVSSLPYNGFYMVAVDMQAANSAFGDVIGEGTFSLLELYEENVVSYENLPSFYNGTTPTAAQWQMLSDRVQSLYSQLMTPRPLFLGGWQEQGVGNQGPVWRGSLYYLHRYLYYDVRIRPPYEDGVTRAVLTVNNTDFELGAVITPTHRYPAPHNPDEGDTSFDFWTFRGTLDLGSLNLAEGTKYPIVLSMTTEGDVKLSTVKLYALWSQTPSVPTRPWWNMMPSWTHAALVAGAGNVKTIRDNLEQLSQRVVYRNLPAVYRHRSQPGLWHTRTYKYLHYYIEPETENPEEVKLGYWSGARWEEISLPSDAGQWHVYDLDSARRLWEGGIYRLSNVSYALEDVEP